MSADDKMFNSSGCAAADGAFHQTQIEPLRRDPDSVRSISNNYELATAEPTTINPKSRKSSSHIFAHVLETCKRLIIIFWETKAGTLHLKDPINFNHGFISFLLSRILHEKRGV